MVDLGRPRFSGVVLTFGGTLRLRTLGLTDGLTAAAGASSAAWLAYWGAVMLNFTFHLTL